MAPMIELPGEANPLTLQNVYNTLVSAASSTQQQVQTGTQQLQNWEKEANYYSLLQEVFVDYSLPVEVRYLSIIQLKNGIDKYWRKTATNAIKKDEKQKIKVKALEAGTVEPAPFLALHNALMIAKIIRYEFPHDWPAAFTSIVGSLRSSVQPGSNPLQLPRTLLILLHIIKVLATGRLQRTRTSLQSVTPEVFHVLGSIYIDKVRRWQIFLKKGGEDEAGAMEEVEQSLLAIKVLRRLLVAGFEHPNREKEVQEFWTITQRHFGEFLSLVVGDFTNLSSHVHKLVEKHLLQLSKLHLEMAKVHPAAFVVLPDCVPLVRAYWGLVVKLGKTYGSRELINSAKISADGDADDEEKPLQEKLGLKALLLIRACAKMAFNPTHTFKYQHPEDKEEKKVSIDLIKTALLSEGFVIEMMELLVTRFFVFRQSDLREWEEEPEEWEKREEEIADAWEFSIRSCSEKLFLDLIINFKQLLVPRLLHVFYSYASPDNREVLLKDSLYSAIGLAAPSLEQQLDFNAFLKATLVPEIQIQQKGYNLLRRRIVILLGQWAPIKPTELDQASIYSIFQHLLDKSDPLNDQVVRVTAGGQLKNVLDPFEITAEEFLPFASIILGRLMNLIKEVDLPETKMGLLETVRVAIVKMENHISPYADRIVALLPPLWEQSEQEHLMKQAILTVLSALINSMKQDSVQLQPIILPLIQKSIEPESDTVIYLLEEALDLWSAILIQTPSPASPSLLSLVPSLFPIYEHGTDSVRQALEITESYLLLAPREIFSDDSIRFRLLTSFETLLGTSTRERNGVVPHLVETLIRCAESVIDDHNSSRTSEAAYTALAKSLLNSSFLEKLLLDLRGTYDSHQSVGPHRKTPTVHGVVETDYFSVLARLCLGDPGIFVSAVSAATGQPVEDSMSWTLNEWSTHFDNIGDVGRKKLSCLAVTRLLTLSSPPPTWILSHLQALMTIWTDVITELSEGAEDRGGDNLILWDENNQDSAFQKDEFESPETGRRRDMSRSDPVHTINIRVFVRDALGAAILACGGEEAFRDEWLVNVDAEVVRGFGVLGLL